MQVIKINPSLLVANCKMAESYFALEHFEQAQALCGQLIENQPGNIDPYFIQCAIFDKRDQKEQLLAMCGSDKGVFSPNIKIYIQLASFYEKAGSADKAFDTLHSATDIDPSNHEVYFHLGNMHINKHQYARSLKAYKTAIDLGSLEAGLFCNYALSLRHVGLLAEAEKVHLRAMELDPNHLGNMCSFRSFVP
jgi:tetratricopeptide (TPR) repeat protein